MKIMISFQIAWYIIISCHIFTCLTVSYDIISFHLLSYLGGTHWSIGGDFTKLWSRGTVQSVDVKIAMCCIFLSLHIVTVTSLDQTQVCEHIHHLSIDFVDIDPKGNWEAARDYMASSCGFFVFSSIVWWYWYLGCLLSNAKAALPWWSFVCKYVGFYCFQHMALRLHTSLDVLLPLHALDSPAKLFPNGVWMSSKAFSKCFLGLCIISHRRCDTVAVFSFGHFFDASAPALWLVAKEMPSTIVWMPYSLNAIAWSTLGRWLQQL